MEQRELTIKSYTHKQLSAIYNCDAKTFRKWLHKLKKEIGPRTGYYFTPRQVKVVVEHLGEP